MNGTMRIARMARPSDAKSHIRPWLARGIVRQYHQSSILQRPDNSYQSRDSIQTSKSEYSKSGGDENTAAQEEAAFDPNKTDPQREKDTAGQGQNGNPLEFSPANQEISKPKAGEKEVKGGGDTTDKQRASRHGKD
jgi:hypothetical protein